MTKCCHIISNMQKQDYKSALRKYRKALRYLDVCWEKDDIDEGQPDSLFCLCRLVYLVLYVVQAATCIFSFSQILFFSLSDYPDKSTALRKTKSQIFTNSSVSTISSLYLSRSYDCHLLLTSHLFTYKLYTYIY